MKARGARDTRGTLGEHGATVGETSLGARGARGNTTSIGSTGSTGVLGTRETRKAATIGGAAVRRIEDPKILKISEMWLKTLKTSAEGTGAQEDTPGDA